MLDRAGPLDLAEGGVNYHELVAGNDLREQNRRRLAVLPARRVDRNQRTATNQPPAVSRVGDIGRGHGVDPRLGGTFQVSGAAPRSGFCASTAPLGALPPSGLADDGGRFPVSRPPVGASDCGGDRTVYHWKTSVARSCGIARMGRGKSSESATPTRCGERRQGCSRARTRCRRDASGGLPGADRHMVPKGGQSACHNALEQLRCTMWPVERRTSRVHLSRNTEHVSECWRPQ